MLIDFSLNLQLSTLNRLPPAVSRWLKPPPPSNWRADRRKIPSKSSWEGRRVAVPDLQKESPKKSNDEHLHYSGGLRPSPLIPPALTERRYKKCEIGNYMLKLV
jgi:hypothetical protein